MPGVDTVRVGLRVEGTVQGVGFRPFVHATAARLALSGMVANDPAGVLIEVEGPADAVARFRELLESRPPPLAVIERITARPLPPAGGADPRFVIAASHRAAGAAEHTPRTPIAPDIATCADCLRELRDPADRRHRYPFLNCTNCGPRYTITRDLPYDRARTTMAGFPMCAACAAEYEDPTDRRFHAQPLCCPACGPTLRLVDAAGTPVPGEPVAAAAGLLRAGRILAIKGLGGYHLAVAAGCEPAAAALRARKHRADKPFAVLVPDLATAERLCELDETARELLTGPHCPIVLAARRPPADRPPTIAASVAPGCRELGLLLPYTPLHHLLAAELGSPAVLTSGNLADEPLAFRDDDAFARLGTLADAFLTHDRPIHRRADDSVIRVRSGRTVPVRRARGCAPAPLPLPVPAARPVLACGAELKSTFCLARGRRAVLSPHLGDLENYETLTAYTDGIADFARLYALEPALIAHDLHPEYLSTKYAHDRADATDARLVGVQHHHAHLGACLTEHQARGPVIGVAFDGLGWGTDGTLWGGEFLLADLCGFRRAAHLVPVPLPGGAAAVREPWRMAAAYLDATGGDGLAVRRRHGERWDHVRALAAAGVNSPLTSSAGRLFDAVAAILSLRDTVRYEGQAAIELERCADPAVRDGYPVRLDCPVRGDDAYRVHGADLVRAAADDVRAGTPPATVAARFHNGVARLIADVCGRLRETTALTTVALSGGVFQNGLLLDRTVPALERAGFRVLTHRRVPCNDGGISLGQAAVAAARDDAAEWG
ncbi:carbamoyltransferase HypF [Streptomyces purpurogeneiscleroticus]|uniref:carbamoyltransferase HypF n=1 Tax=Streptomyces purpurogeneiscleroticus TaxID=68259 RepID=UPI001CBDE16F|nr:carbamoyltransferase HypF [Streptomyces purpurogeneiscleroticus]MBZ4016815.1 carbamoyltransferase HypF [Streptomyces purpurogeneiscleroticus]